MTTTLSEGVKVPDVGSVNWAGDLEVNWNLLNGALANLSGNVKTDRDNTWTGEQSFTLPIVGSITGTAAKAIADEDGTSIKTGYGKLAGNQTWTGSNTFSGIKSTGVIRVEKSSGDTEFEIVNGEVDATTNTLSRQDDIRFYDKNTKITGGLRLTYTTDTGTKIELYARSWKADGTASYNRSMTIYTNGQTGEYYTTLETNFQPKITGVYSLGTSSYQWSSVYAQSYYYNGTAWGLDKSNVWTGASNTFSSILNQNINSIYSEIPSSDHFAVKGITDNNGDNVFAISFADRSSGQRDVTFRVYNTDGTQQGVGLYKNNDGSHDYKPMSSNAVNLGTSTNQWKSVYANSYYYNGVAWGLDKVNEWSETNAFTKAYSDATYSAIFGFSNLKSVHTSPLAVFFDVRGSSNYASYGAGLWAGYVTTGSVRYGHLKFVRTTDKRGETNSGTILDTNFSFIDMAFHYSMINFMESVRITNDGTENSLKPITTSVTDLGTSTNKWKTLNGINPGALSLPDKDKRIAIDTTGWTYTGSYANQILINGAIQTISGWLYIRIENTTASDYVTIRMNAVAIENPTLIQPGSSATPVISVLFPVVAGVPVYVYTTKAPAKIYLYECLGNV